MNVHDLTSYNNTAGSTKDPDGSTAIDFLLTQGESALDTGLNHPANAYLFLHKNPRYKQRRLKSCLLVLHHQGLKGGKATSLLTRFCAFHATVTERRDTSRMRTIFSYS